MGIFLSRGRSNSKINKEIDNKEIDNKDPKQITNKESDKRSYEILENFIKAADEYYYDNIKK